MVNKINFEEVIVEKEKEGKNVNEIEGMDFKIIKEDKIENIKEEHKKVVKERKNEKKNEKKEKEEKSPINNKVMQLYVQLNEKIKEVEHLKNQLIGCIKYDNLDIDEKLIAVNFISGDQRINFPIICKSSTKFIDVEQKLYQKYPEYAKNDGKDNLFLSNGKQLEKFKTMEQKGLQAYNIIVIKNNSDDSN